MSNNISVLGNRLFVRPFSKEKTTESGLIIPDTVQQNTEKGTVIYAGETKQVKPGDTVHFDARQVVKRTVLNEELLIMNEDNVLYYESNN